MHSCAVYMRAWVCAYSSLSDGASGKAALFMQLRGSTYMCVCLCTVRGQIQWCAGAISHQLTRPNSTPSLSNSVFSEPCWYLEIGHGGSIYTTETSKCYKSGLFLFNYGEPVVNAYQQHTTGRIHASRDQAHSSSFSSWKSDCLGSDPRFTFVSCV